MNIVTVIFAMMSDHFLFALRQGFVYHVISAAAEWTMAICFLAYFLTLAPEFKKLSLAPLKLVHRQASYTDEVARCIESDDERDVIA